MVHFKKNLQNNIKENLTENIHKGEPFWWHFWEILKNVIHVSKNTISLIED